jgi:predicted kinase
MKFQNFLITEKQIVISGSKGKNYGNVVMLAGGSASGKGFAVSNFLEGNLFKIRDIDEVKRLLIDIDKLKGIYPEIRGLDLRNPKHVFQLHSFVAAKKIKNKTLDLLLTNIKNETLPNILFDITFAKPTEPLGHIQKLIEIGYDPKDVNFVWVLQNYYLSVELNKDRPRVVPDDVLLHSHEHAAVNMVKLIRNEIPELADKKIFDGRIVVIFNNPDNTVYYKPSNFARKNSKGEPIKLIKDFKYMALKERGQPIKSEQEVQKELLDQIRQNIPKTDLTKFLWPDA